MEAFEKALRKAVSNSASNGPETLRRALRYALFPGGGRVRPKLVLSIVRAHRETIDNGVLGAAMAVELVHCASLVHDDLPCFDDAPFRRGKPSVHRMFGEGTAVLVGDALISMAFDVLAASGVARPERIGPMVRTLAAAIGPANGLTAGQAFEEEPGTSVDRIHAGKTGALFEASAAFGARLSGVEEVKWRAVGQKIGQAYQIADDILDAAGDSATAGKPVAQDARNMRPSAVREADLRAAMEMLERRIAEAVALVPLCPGRGEMVSLLKRISTRLCPEGLAFEEAARGGRSMTGGSPGRRVWQAQGA